MLALSLGVEQVTTQPRAECRFSARTGLCTGPQDCEPLEGTVLQGYQGRAEHTLTLSRGLQNSGRTRECACSFVAFSFRLAELRDASCRTDSGLHLQQWPLLLWEAFKTTVYTKSPIYLYVECKVFPLCGLRNSLAPGSNPVRHRPLWLLWI